MESGDVQKFVLWSLDHVGWYPELWFPHVRREAINFPDGPSDAEVHAALFALIQAGSVEITKTMGTSSIPVRNPTAAVLEDLRASRESDYKLELNANARQLLHAALERARIPPRGHFEVMAHGKDFDVDAYVRSAPLEFDLVWRRVEGGRATSGVSRLLGNGRAIPLWDQQRIAAEFLASNRDALRALAGLPGVETFIIGLQFNIEIGDSLFGFALGPTARLMQCALDVGVSPTFYVVRDPPGEPSGFSVEIFLQGW